MVATESEKAKWEHTQLCAYAFSQPPHFVEVCEDMKIGE